MYMELRFIRTKFFILKQTCTNALNTNDSKFPRKFRAMYYRLLLFSSIIDFMCIYVQTDKIIFQC